MTEINHQLVERYQLLYEKDPKSKIFAPLAEAYRKMGLLQEALGVAKDGVRIHPFFPSGRLALAKILLDLKKTEEAIEHLQKAVEISPENVLAQTLLAKSFMDLRKPKEALKAYKMLLFLNPEHKVAQSAVKRLESMSADDFDQDIFTFKDLKSSLEKVDFIERAGKQDEDPQGPHQTQRYLERMISLADAFIVRNDTEKAIATLEKANEQVGKQPEIEKRLQMLKKRMSESIDPPLDPKRKKIAFLERLLLRIEERQA